MLQRHIFSTFLTKTVVFLGAITQGIFVTRLLGPEGKGLFSFLQANIALFTLMLGLALPTGIVFFSANKKIPQEKILGLSYYFGFVGFLILALLCFLSVYFPNASIILPSRYDTFFYAAYFCFSFIFSFLSGAYFAVFSGNTYFGTLNLIELSTTLIRLFIFGGAYLFKDVFALVIWQIFLADITITILNFIFCLFASKYFLKLKISFQLDWKTQIRPVLNYIIPLYWVSLIAFAYNRIDFWIVENQRGLAELGIYSIAIGCAQLLTFFPMTINTVLYPYLTQKEGNERIHFFKLFSKINFSFVLLAAIVLFFISNKLITSLYGQSFSNAVMPFKILVWGYMLSSIKLIFTLNNQINQKLKVNIISELIVLFIAVSMNILIVPKYGIIGSSISMVTANIFSIAFLLLSMKKIYLFSLSDLFLFKTSDFKILKTIKESKNL